MPLFDRNLYIIAEIANAAQGIAEANHHLIESVATTGVDAVKLQFYKYDELATPRYEKYETFRRTFYTERERLSFIAHASDAGLDVIIDIFDRWGLDVAKKAIDQINGVKIPPAILMDEEIAKNIFDLKKPVLLGVGGYDDKTIDLFLSKVASDDMQIALLHGFQGFPTHEKDTSLARINHLKTKYGLPVGYADHIDAESDIALRLPEYALFAGATIIEKHVTLDRRSKGLDYYSALLPKEFTRMVKNLNRCVRIMGSITVSCSEKDYQKHATRVTTVDPIKAGHILSANDVKFRRTDNTMALFPNEVDKFFPAVALHDLSKDSGICKQDIRKAAAGVIVVCRLNSKRLHRKALLDLNKIPAIERCLLNTLNSKLASMTILATSTHSEDEILREHILNYDIKFFQGSENDPAGRMLDAAELYGIDIIVRVTGDSPLVSYELIDLLIESHIQAGADYSCLKGAPLGAKSEVINTQAILKLKAITETDGYSEYLSLYFKNNPEIFRLNELVVPPMFYYPQYRINLDYQEDYELLQSIFEGLNVGRKALPLARTINYLTKHPEIAQKNSSIIPKYKETTLSEQLDKATRIYI